MTGRTLLQRSNTIAWWYLTFGAAFFIAFAYAASIMWTGSMAAVFRDALAGSRPFLITGAVAAIHFATAFFCFRFVNRSKPSQLAALLGATVIFGVNAISSAAIAAAWFEGTLTPGISRTTLLLAFAKPCAYGWLEYELILLMRASNDRIAQSADAAPAAGDEIDD
jgi:hypothetical protein